MIFPGLLSSDVTGICDVFTQRRYFNGPIWFLLCLFWTNIIFCFLTLHVRSEKLRLLLVLLIGLLGALLGKKEFFIPCMFDVAMTSLPFFYLGFLLKKSSILYPNKNDRFNWLFISLFGMISIFIEHFYNYPQIIFLINAINGSLLAAWLLGGCSVLFILFLCKSIGKLPIVSYVGRYSIISLCLHYYMCRLFPIVLRLLGIDFAGSEYVVLFVTLCFCWVCIPFCIKYIPWFVAQKDLLSLPILREKRIKENNNELIK